MLTNPSIQWINSVLGNQNAGLEVLRLQQIEYKDLTFSNGDTYQGGWRDGQPEGEGRYTWSNGSSYEGSWMKGTKHGWGKYIWPNGSVYVGEWQHDALHGIGTYESPDGSQYQGGWAKNLKHGYGTKKHACGDIYAGLWANGAASGPGRYRWRNGDEYDGTWLDGVFDGQGTFKWSNGERYDGEWHQGYQHGIGVYSWPNKSTYEGFWRGGKKDGVGVFRPPPSHRASHQIAGGIGKLPGVNALPQLANIPLTHLSNLHHALQGNKQQQQQTTVGNSSGNNSNTNGAVVVVGGDSAVAAMNTTTTTTTTTDNHNTTNTTTTHDTTLDIPPPSPTTQQHNTNNTNSTTSAVPRGGATGPRPAEAALAELRGDKSVYICEYKDGELILEEAMARDDLELVLGPAAALHQSATPSSSVANNKNTTSRRSQQSRRARRRRSDTMGETIFKGSRSYDLMLNLQLGIRYTLGTLSKVPLPPKLTPQHFEEKIWLKFPHQGSEVTPPHPSKDFKWKDYAPMVFRHLRELFGIANSDYILSTCSESALKELASPGKSGSVFFVSQDERFLIKTVRKEEVKLLLRALPSYTKHVTAHPSTLLTRFFGIHRIKPFQGGTVRFVVMTNIFRTELPLHQKYDLKGSTYKRTVGVVDNKDRGGIILKDLDLDVKFLLDQPIHEQLMKQLKLDTKLLEDLHVMDYSLLMGVHYKGRVDMDMNDAGDTRDMTQGMMWDEAFGRQPTNTSDSGLLIIDEDGENETETTSVTSTSMSNGYNDARFVSGKTVSDKSTGNSGSFYVNKGQSGVLLSFMSDMVHREPSIMTPAACTLDINTDMPVVNTSAIVPAVAPRTDFEKEVDVMMHSVVSKDLADMRAISVVDRPKARFGLTQFFSWRRQMKEKKRQKTQQQLGIAPSIRSSGTAFSLDMLTQWTGSKQQQLWSVETGQASETTHGSALTSPISSHTEVEADDTIVWRAHAAENPDEGLMSVEGSGTLPPTPAAGGAERPVSFVVLQSQEGVVNDTGDSSGGGGVNKNRSSTAPTTTANTNSDESITTSTAPITTTTRHSISLNRPSPLFPQYSPFEKLSITPSELPDRPSSSLQRTYSDPTKAVAGVDGAHVAAAILRGDAESSMLLDSPEAAALIARVKDNLNKPLSNQLVEDLIRLARHKILVPTAKRKDAMRLPTDVLAARHTRVKPGTRSNAPAGDGGIGVDGGVRRPSGSLESPLMMTAIQEEHDAVLPSPSTPPVVSVMQVNQFHAVTAPMGNDNDNKQAKGEETVVFLGLIDWLQPYNARKRVEHGFKSIVQDGKSISVQEPRAYSNRFLKFMSTVFVGAK